MWRISAVAALSTAIALGGSAGSPALADSSDADLLKFFGTAVLIFGIAQAIEDDDKAKQAATKPRRQRKGDGFAVSRPNKCVRRFRSGNRWEVYRDVNCSSTRPVRRLAKFECTRERYRNGTWTERLGRRCMERHGFRYIRNERH